MFFFPLSDAFLATIQRISLLNLPNVFLIIFPSVTEMSCPKGNYVNGVLKGLQSVIAEIVKLQESQCRTAWNKSVIKSAADQSSTAANGALKSLSQIEPVQVIRKEASHSLTLFLK